MEPTGKITILENYRFHCQDSVPDEMMDLFNQTYFNVSCSWRGNVSSTCTDNDTCVWSGNMSEICVEEEHEGNDYLYKVGEE